MSQRVSIPSIPSPCTSTSSDAGPRTPEPNSPIAGHNGSENANTANAVGSKRKPNRRANTAERRATHNAVERQRRETLNGRFLDLAKLLPNLSQIRRPSKSAIVNSSIAHIHASRRHRALSSRELRLLKYECDHLRRELNEWRDRAGIPQVEEPVRGEGFGMVLEGELEIIPVTNGPVDEEEDGLYGEENSFDHEVQAGAIGVEEQARLVQSQYTSVPSVNTPFSQHAPQPPLLTRSNSNPHPMITSPTRVSFDNLVLGAYDSHVQPSAGGQTNVEVNPYPNTLNAGYDKQCKSTSSSASGTQLTTSWVSASASRSTWMEQHTDAELWEPTFWVLV
uniref:BHLH domain-containing protein n=1 Tax=Moniliophthora roreri TaxID=221103 RepID=A0A0W0FJ73_MONRR